MNPSEQLLQAAKSGSTREVRKLLSRGALFVKDKFGNTALHEVAWTGNTDITKLLLKAHCFVDSVNGTGFTPLHLASQNGHAKIAKTLLKWKANPSVTNQHGETPLHLVAKYDHAHLIPVFAAAKVDLDLRAKDDNTALHIASKLGNTSTVKALVHYGANPNLPNQKGLLALDYAEMNVYADTIKLLMPVTVQMRRRAQTMDSFKGASPQQQHQDAELRNSKLKLPFRKTKSPKEVWSRVNQQRDEIGPVALAPVHLRRHHTHLSPKSISPNGRRYSREFEDLPRFSSSRSPAATTTAPSIEQLLSEVEKEVNGPDYRYLPPTPSDDSEDGASVTYSSIHRAEGPMQRRYTSPTLLKPPQQPLWRANTTTNTQADKKKNHVYDNLRPLAKDQTSPQKGSYISIHFSSSATPGSEPGVRTSPDGQDQGLLEEEHDYEELPPVRDDDFDSYVYMAPSKDKENKKSSAMKKDKIMSHSSEKLPLKSSLSNGSIPNRSPKKAVVLDSAVTLETKFEPNTKMQPRRPILAQSSADSADSRTRLQKYMEEELDTIRQAFQIRLSQMEKRYQRQLVSVQQEAISRSPQPFQDQSRHQPALQRRASWNGADKRNQEVQPRVPSAAPLKLDFESGSDESLNSCTSANSSVCSSTMGTPTPGEHREGGLHSSAQDTLSQDELQAFAQQMKTYKSQMMDAMMVEAEKKAQQMEEQYRRMREMAVNQGQQNGVAPHFTHVRGNGVSINVNDQPETFV